MATYKYKNAKRILPLIMVVFAFFNCNDEVQVPVEEKGTVIKEKSFTTEILTELEKRGYDVDLINEINTKNKAALVKFQKNHGLPSFCGGSEQVLRFLKGEPVLEEELEQIQRKELNVQIQNILKKRGYDVEITGIIDDKTKIAITKFRTDNGIPIVNNGNERLLLKSLGVIPPYLSKEISLKIQKALKEKDYDVEITGKFDTQTKVALIKLQKDIGLPVPTNGSMIPVLKALGIDTNFYEKK